MEELDWVTSRFNCSLARLFKQLELGCKKDANTLRGLERPDPNVGGRAPKEVFVEGNGGEFSVTRRDAGNAVLRSVTFKLESDAISVSGDFEGAPQFAAAPTLSSDGKCLMAVEGQELHLWQVRSKALQRLFFAA